uniref:Uncharacterized protein n=2 Tax=Haptolina brevifila TaxID=156173 RepID=A0A7S2MKZ8_9EUKA|mmetsp:Transcript_54075/g.107416  ORF Transcript_54075/g.107416 Transcript_54075/m.107416 type:complete len:335 (+) Transcript_54075:685-1689(+)
MILSLFKTATPGLLDEIRTLAVQVFEIVNGDQVDNIGGFLSKKVDVFEFECWLEKAELEEHAHNPNQPPLKARASLIAKKELALRRKREMSERQTMEKAHVDVSKARICRKLQVDLAIAFAKDTSPLRAMAARMSVMGPQLARAQHMADGEQSDFQRHDHHRQQPFLQHSRLLDPPPSRPNTAPSFISSLDLTSALARLPLASSPRPSSPLDLSPRTPSSILTPASPSSPLAPSLRTLTRPATANSTASVAIERTSGSSRGLSSALSLPTSLLHPSSFHASLIHLHRRAERGMAEMRWREGETGQASFALRAPAYSSPPKRPPPKRPPPKLYHR